MVRVGVRGLSHGGSKSGLGSGSKSGSKVRGLLALHRVTTAWNPVERSVVQGLCRVCAGFEAGFEAEFVQGLCRVV